MKIKKTWYFTFLCTITFIYCNHQDHSLKKKGLEMEFARDEKLAIDSLQKHDLLNYLDSAYLYTYVYFGMNNIIRCGSVNIDSIIPLFSERKIICQDLLLRNVRVVNDSSFLFLNLTPLVNDSVLSCDMVDGPALPYEILFNYKTKQFIQFVYSEYSYLKVEPDPIHVYEHDIKPLIDSGKIKPHNKFKELISKITLKR